METSIEVLTQIRDYVSGQMSQEEIIAFEALLKNNPSLIKEVELAKKLVRATEKAEYQRLFNQIKKADNEKAPLPKRSPLSLIKTNKIALIAASFLLLTIAGFWWSSPKRDVVNSFLTEAYIPPQNSDALRSETGASIPKPYVSYKKGNYQQSIELINQFPIEDSLYLHLQLLKGHDYIQLEDYEEATKILNQLVIQKESEHNYLQPNWDNVGWTRLLALTYQFQQTKNKEDAIQLKKHVEIFLDKAAPSDTYHQKALELKKLLVGA